jgi:ribosome-associated protein
MDIRKLQRVIVDGLEDVKAQNIVVFNTEHLSPLFERVIIASGTSNRQTKALAASVRDAVKAAGDPPPRIEGEENGEWIIVDCGSAVVHVMQPTFRDYYHLEELWGEKPVRMKMSGASTAPARLAFVPPPHGGDGEDRAPAAARKAAPSRSAASGHKAAAGKKPAAGKPPGRKTPAPKPVVRESGRRSASAAASPAAAGKRPAAPGGRGPSRPRSASGPRGAAKAGPSRSGPGRAGASRPGTKPASARKTAPRKGGPRG